jgi:hypothetical protein
MRAGSEEGTYAITPVIGKPEISGGESGVRTLSQRIVAL